MAVLDFLLSSDDEASGAPARRGRASGSNRDALQPRSSASTSAAKPAPRKRRAPASDDEEVPDITDALLGPRGGSKGKALPPRPAPVDDDGSGDEQFIAAATQRQNKKAGTEVARDVSKAKNGGKGKKTGGGVVAGGGSFQSMGLPPQLLRSLLLRGYTTPTPIQRLAVPSLMATPTRDLVGMARTGSGKTLAYMLPLLTRLGGKHSTTVGVKSVILCPSRELALQILRVGKELARGWKVPDAEPLRWALVVGGEGLEEQFALLAANPDVLIATPGRLLHLAVEANLDLSAVQYVVFDEADRLFEMGFASQLEELLARLPPGRQTALFSATLPKSLVDFARAGLAPNPKLVRLDADAKISADLKMTFLSVKPSEKEAALLVLLRDVIGVPFGSQAPVQAPNWGTGANAPPPEKRRKGTVLNGADELMPHQTIVFCATKHHVEYLLALLQVAGWTCAHIYSSLHQAARTLEMKRFRDGEASLLIVTDVAARGIDLPSMAHVVNYDLPASPRVFVHRVGRTARAGKSGWAWSIVTGNELPHLCDLQLFLARPLEPAPTPQGGDGTLDLHSSLRLGTLPRQAIDTESEHILTGLHASSSDAAVALPALRQVVTRAQKLYERSSIRASQESHRRAKGMLRGDGGWALAGNNREESGVHDVIRRPAAYGLNGKGPAAAGEGSTKAPANRRMDEETALAREALLAKINGFNPSETVFEVGTRGANPLTNLMRDRRRTLAGKQAKAAAREAHRELIDGTAAPEEEADEEIALDEAGEVEMAGEDEIEDVFDVPNASKKRARREASGKKDYKDPEFYINYTQKDAHTEKGYSLSNGGTFAEQAAHATFSLGNDEATLGTRSQAPNAARWDVKKKKFIRGDGIGADNEKYIRTESGSRLPASFRSGRFDEWKKTQKVAMQKVGEQEDAKAAGAAWQLAGMTRGGARGGRGGGNVGRGGGRGGAAGGRTFRHNSYTAPKPLDPLRKDYQKQVAKRSAAAEARGGEPHPASAAGARGGRGGGRGGARGRGAASRGRGMARGSGRPGQHVRNELKSAAAIQKTRQLAAQRKEKNARAPSRKRGGKR